MSVSGGHRAGWEGPWSQLQATFSPVGDGTRKLGILPPCWTPGWAWGPPTHTPQGSLVPSVQPHSSPDRFPPPALPAGAWPPRTLPGMQDGACRWYRQVLVHQRAPRPPPSCSQERVAWRAVCTPSVRRDRGGGSQRLAQQQPLTVQNSPSVPGGSLVRGLRVRRRSCWQGPQWDSGGPGALTWPVRCRPEDPAVQLLPQAAHLLAVHCARAAGRPGPGDWMVGDPASPGSLPGQRLMGSARGMCPAPGLAPQGVLSQCPPLRSQARGAALGVLPTNGLSSGRRAPWRGLWLGVRPVVHGRGSASGSVLPSGEGAGYKPGRASWFLSRGCSWSHLPLLDRSLAWSTRGPPSGLSCLAAHKYRGIGHDPSRCAVFLLPFLLVVPVGSTPFFPTGWWSLLCVPVSGSLWDTLAWPLLSHTGPGRTWPWKITPIPLHCLWASDAWACGSGRACLPFLLLCNFLSLPAAGSIFPHRALISESSFLLQAGTAFPLFLR